MPHLTRLVESGQLSTAVLAALPGTGVIVYDRDLRVVLAAGQALEMHGWDAAAMEGRTLDDLLPPERFERLVKNYRAALDGEVLRFDSPSPDGKAVYRNDIAPIREAGEVVAGVLMARDVTEARLAAAAVAESEQRYRLLAEHSTDMISRHREDGTFIFASPAARDLLGYEPDELVGMNMLDRHHPEDVAARRSVDAMPGRRTYEYRFKRRDGWWIWLESTVQAVADEETGAVELTVVTRDVSERKLREQDRELLLEREREQTERLRHLDKLKDEFVGFVSHELRTPLTSIRGYVDLLIEYGENLDDEQRQFLATVDRNGERLNRLIEDLLAYFQVEGGEVELRREELDMTTLLEEAVESAGPAAVRKRVGLTTRLGTGAFVVGDEGRLAQVIDNLLSNAIKYTPEGGEIEVSLGLDGDSVVLSVADTGIGIPAEEHERLFERFFRASTAIERSISGTGLGLAITKALVEAHGGTICAEPCDPGTRFTVTVPLAVAALAA